MWRTYIFVSVVVCFGSTSLSASERVDFDTEIIPVLTKQGCNAGACHGAASGRGGFKLSLLGSNAANDHDAIVRQLEGRRVNLADPSRSLVLLKPSEQMGHEGGQVLEEDSEGFRRLESWIGQGARRSERRALVDLVISPSEATIGRPESRVPISVTATYQDGSSRDVTRWTVFQATDSDAVTIDPTNGEAIVHRRGVHVVIARFLDRVMPIRLTVPMRDEALPGDELPELTKVDQFVNEELRRLRLPATPAASDWKFLRRIMLDLTGKLPSAAEANAFYRDNSPNKRSRVIRELLQSEAFADYWSLKWANDLGIDSRQLQAQGADAYHKWLRDQLRNDTPWNQMAVAMLTETGDSYEDGALNFLRSAGNPGELAERTSRSLMGVRLQCANCHDHPLDHWKQDDYHGLAAIFAKLNRQRIVSLSKRGEVTHPVTRQAAIPRVPGEDYLDPESDGRVDLADWLTDPKNPYFAKAMVNRIWRNLMGRGLVDPVDDLRATNPATHPRLLKWLADDFVEHGFRVHHTIQLICESAAYGRDSVTLPENKSDRSYYSHALVKPLEAEVIADAITTITGVPLRQNDAEVERAITLTNNRLSIPSLEVLGRCDRQASCTEAGLATSLARSLHLINGDLINRRVAARSGRLAELLDSIPDDAQLLDQIFLETISKPNASRQPYWQAQLQSIQNASTDTRRVFFEDVLWGLLTSRAFMSNQ